MAIEIIKPQNIEYAFKKSTKNSGLQLVNACKYKLLKFDIVPI
jgi:ABC-type branched-subunit amino acid transport system substrate-binding protein